MITYKGDFEIWNALRDGKKLCTIDSTQMSNTRDLKDKDNAMYKILYYTSNPQMNRVFAHFLNGDFVDHDMTLWEIHHNEWVD
jgi:hypothetical protein